jgi:O-antigen ligase
MKKIRISQNRIFTHRFPIAGEIYRVLGIILCFLGLGLLAVGLYMAPKLATMGLVFIGLGIPIMFLLWYQPEFGLLALIFLTSSLIPSDTIDVRLPIGGGLDLRDLLLIGMMGILVLHALSSKSFVIPWWPVSAPLLFFLFLAIFSTLYALIYQNVESNWALSDLRFLTFYCIFFVTGWAIKSKQQLTTVLVGLFLIADCVAGVVILQQFLGANNVLLVAMSSNDWKVYDIHQNGASADFGTVRIMPPGVVLVYFAMVLSSCLLVLASHSKGLRTILGLQFMYLNFSIILTYTRALWIASVIALILVLIVLFSTYGIQLIRTIATGIILLGLFFGLLYMGLKNSISDPALATAFIERFDSILTPEKTVESYSLQWRIFEQEEGLRSVSEHPLIGVGLGNSYRKVTTLQGESTGWLTHTLAAGELSRYTRFLHNSYLSIAVKMGLTGLACFLWFCIAVLINGWIVYRNLHDGQAKAVTLAVLTSFIGLMFWSFFHQHFIQTESTATIGLMAGFIASLQQMLDNKNGFEQPSSQHSRGNALDQ